jgi:23S rRNA (adenine2503-C2)-methyltransferase
LILEGIELKFLHIKTRNDKFESRYFDFQRSHKYLVCLDDKLNIETTAYEHFFKNAPTHIAIDISTMVGCSSNCAFCASASIKFERSLHVEEIVEQVKFSISKFAGQKFKQITCSFQGIGEPSYLPEKIVESSRSILELDERVVLSLSTICANKEGLYRIISSGLPFENVQLSLCGTTNDVKKSLTPMAIGPDRIAQVAKNISNLKNIKKVKINYILMDGVNDNEKDLNYLIESFHDSKVIVKISSLNKTISSIKNSLITSNKKAARSFSKRLIANGIDSYVFGAFCDIGLSCGQLLGSEE